MRGLCVHNLPIIYQLVMLMDDGLSEHILVELCLRWHQGLEDMVLASSKKDEVRANIVVLMQSAGVSNEKIAIAKQSSPSIKMLLDQLYATGTERAKKFHPCHLSKIYDQSEKLIFHL